ncbi:MAG TPA: sigma-70 family RNA polymerase sigma factor [Nocardioides sp.]|uniref:RNA polymerase sigma factor n=1 Tax=uncultured Nocardioides sp. TaxID=198441 RepID=UPI0026240BAB|nr:sigma-70 family RNA polymerase sigma factor [uncultured Nocardioides sp.]HRD59527.1 sigma-70 family RNA polymerase sigma factor [Nocardioides sp.]HRI95196.1 sigma-70 family RNA polymerase sigma factor [Nocardioides sp.]HRK45476.1 sigma-70 family RNA polymerase sigma factor [Nocardioides sp.]
MSSDDGELVAALRAGDEAAFTRLVTDWSRPMLLLARGFVSTEASAEEVVQDTWLAVIRGLDAFEGRAALRTWVYRILVNIAKTRGVKEHRSLPWSSLGAEDEGPTVDPGLFRGPEDQYAGGWKSFPSDWRTVEDRVLEIEIQDQLRTVLERLPERQRIVLTLRDVVGCSSDEVCELLDVSAANQRVLLHRARAGCRQVLARYLAAEPSEEVS